MSSEDKRRRSRRINFFDNLDRIVERFLAEARYIGIDRPYRRVVPFMSEYSIRIGPDGKPIVREIGESRIFGSRKFSHVIKDPLIDVIDEDSRVVIILELPGVSREDIDLKISDYRLILRIDSPQNRYLKEIELPSKIESSRATADYRNGILEVRIPKSKD